ncbi:MAG: MarC family protein [Methanomassiliicoccus sp.]|nr:MarC family protein [Methanomassiliicoccus sp.]
MDATYFVTVLVTLFAIINPVGNVAIFEAVTSCFDATTKRTVAKRAIIFSAAVLLAFGIFGDIIFRIFGITLPGFRVMGGILLFYLGFNLVEGQGTTHKVSEECTQEEAISVAIVPLTIPLYAGPGSIAVTMVLVSQSTGPVDLLLTLGAVLIILGLSYVLIVNSEAVFKRLGKNGSIAFTRIMGVLLAGMGTTFVISGIIDAVKQAGLG